MKKLALALVCFASVAFFASCNPVVDNPEPTIAVISGDNYITGTVDNPTIIDATDPDAINLKYGFHVESNAQTKKELSYMKLYYEQIDEDGTLVYDTTIDLTGQTSSNFEDFVFVQEEKSYIAEVTIKAVVADVDGKTNTATIAFKVDLPAQPLIARTIEWTRRGSNALNAEEMAEYGLQWLARDAYHANIRPLNGYQLYVTLNNADAFNNIGTDVDLAAYFANLAESAEPVEEYRNISTAIPGDTQYNDVLATIDGEGHMHIILFEKANVQTGSFGTQTIITGQVK